MPGEDEKSPFGMAAGDLGLVIPPASAVLFSRTIEDHYIIADLLDEALKVDHEDEGYVLA